RDRDAVAPLPGHPWPGGLARALRRLGRRQDPLPRVRLHRRGRGRGREGVARRLRRVRADGAGPARPCPARPSPLPIPRPTGRPAVTGFPESPHGRIGTSPALTPTTAVRHRAHTPGRNDMAQNTTTQALSDAGVSIWL